MYLNVKYTEVKRVNSIKLICIYANSTSPPATADAVIGGTVTALRSRFVVCGHRAL